MKKKIFLTLLLGVLMLVPSFVMAAEDEVMPISEDRAFWDTFQAGDYAKGETSGSNDLFIFDEQVKTSGVYNGTSFFLGNNVTTDAIVDGISFVAGNNIVSTTSSDYAFYVGNSISYSGTTKDLFMAGNSVIIDGNANVGRRLYITANTVNIGINFNDNGYIDADKVTIDSTIIDGDLTINANRIEFTNDISIAGTFKYNEDALIIGLDKVVAGNVTTMANVDELSISDTIFTTIVSIIGTIVLGLVAILFAPKTFEAIEKKNTKLKVIDVFKYFGLGLAVLIILPVILFLLIFTVVGMQVSIVALILYIVGIIVSSVISGYFVGDLVLTKILKKKSNCYLAIMLGVLIVKLLGVIPYVAGFFSVIFVSIGLGILSIRLTTREK